jgi:hypothetical protein
VTTTARTQLAFLKSQGLSQIEDFILNQLEYDPTNSDKKRVSEDGTGFVLAYKTWRVRFELKDNSVNVLSLFSGYSAEDLASSADPYSDKNLHREFLRRF